MIKKEKQLLLKDLCSRLPYGARVFVPGFSVNEELKTKHIDAAINDYGIRPYLRPMSSMTDEEIDRMWEIYESGPAAESSVAVAEYLYERHLDCHYLIEKGLALEAPEEMYK